jgi:CubicO group peptidase (beta-lactamase class C family)
VNLSDQDALLPADSRLQEVRAAMSGLVGDGGLPSLAVAVARDGAIAWEEGFGLADVESGGRATAHTPYRVASVAKSLTASGVMLLMQRGEIDLDAPIAEYVLALSSYRARASELRLRHVVNMTGGIPHYWQYYYPARSEPVLPTPEVIKRYGYLATRPGDLFLYSNLSYAFAERVIEEVSGRPFAEYMRSELFGPLNMLHSYADVAAASGDELASGYDAGRNRIQPGYLMEPRAGAGAVSSAHDLALFALAHLGVSLPGQEPLFKPETLEIMHRQDDPRPPNYLPYSMGWGIVESGKYLSLISNGAIAGAAASILLLPGEQMAVVCLTNMTSRKTDELVLQIADALLPGFAEDWAGTAAKWEDEPAAEIGFEELAGEWVGTLASYEGEIPVKITGDRCGTLFLKVGDGLRGVVDDLSFSGKLVRGQALGRILTEEARRHNHNLELELSYEQDKLSGTITAVTTDMPAQFGLPHYVQLTRAGGG